jgi:hypothetical protein
VKNVSFARKWLVVLVVLASIAVVYPAGASSSLSGAESACFVWESHGLAECFASEKELDSRLAELREGESDAFSMLAQCSTGLRLYDGTGYSGSVLVILDRLLWINLSNYGFDNRTSSYKVGACSSYLAENASGGGSWYPTSATQAWDQASSMQSGWSNRVSSVYQT